MDVAGLVSGRGPDLPFVTSIDQIELLASRLIFELGSELQCGTHQSNRASCMFLVPFLVSLLNLATNSCLRHLSLGLSFVDVPGLVAGRGPELPFATHTCRSDRAS